MARPTRITVPNGTPATVPVDYLSDNLNIQVVLTGGANCTITATLDDPNDPTYTAVFVALPAPFNAALVANTLSSLSNFQLRALKITTSVSGSSIVTLVQSSGSADS